MRQVSTGEDRKKNDARSRVRNAAIVVSDAITRMDKASSKFAKTVKSAMEGDTLTEADVVAAIQEATTGRPDRQEALVRFIQASQEIPTKETK